MSGFLVGLLIGLLIGTMLGIFIIAACFVAGDDDEKKVR